MLQIAEFLIKKMEGKGKVKSTGLMTSPLHIYQAFMDCLLCAGFCALPGAHSDVVKYRPPGKLTYKHGRAVSATECWH